MHNREGLSLQDLWRSICDFDLWPLYVVRVVAQGSCCSDVKLGLTTFIAPQTISNYFTLTLKSL